jgi:hypothetical protein
VAPTPEDLIGRLATPVPAEPDRQWASQLCRLRAEQGSEPEWAQTFLRALA